MAILSGGGNWLTLQKAPIGTVTRGDFVSFEADVPSANPAYPPQGVLTLEMDGQSKKIGCPTALSRVFQANRVEPGASLAITYEGPKKGKKGTPFHSFSVELLEGSTAFPPAANEPDRELEARLEAARARRAA